MTPLSVLAVDDEAPALDEIAYLLDRCPLAGEVETASDATDALRRLQNRPFDVVLLDIRMPGLDGLELARVLGHFATRPSVVFVTAHEEYAVGAFEVDAVDYLLKPVDEDRLAAALGRVAAGRAGAPVDAWQTLAVERFGRTVLVARADVEWVEAAGDYVRVHTREEGSHLLRIPMSQLQEHWSVHGFARIHRGYLVALGAIREIRTEGSQNVVVVAGHELPVSRRHLHELRERLVAVGPRSRR